MSGSSWGRAAVGGGRPIAKPFDGRQEIDVNVIANGLIGLVTQNHVGFLVREMFWDHPVGRRIFGMTPELSAKPPAGQICSTTYPARHSDLTGTRSIRGARENDGACASPIAERAG